MASRLKSVGPLMAVLVVVLYFGLQPHGQATIPPSFDWRVEPTTLDFGEVVYQEPKSMDVLIINQGIGGLVPNVSAQPPTTFVGVQLIGCTQVIPVGGHCIARYTFHAPGTGSHDVEATLTVDGRNHTIRLRAQTYANFKVAPLTLSFADTVVGQESAPQFITITNLRSVPWSRDINLIAWSGPLSVDRSECPDGPHQVGPGTSCRIRVVFKPTVVGPQPPFTVINIHILAIEHYIGYDIPVTGRGVAPPPTTVTTSTTTTTTSTTTTTPTTSTIATSTTEPGDGTTTTTTPSETTTTAEQTGTTLTLGVDTTLPEALPPTGEDPSGGFPVIWVVLALVAVLGAGAGGVWFGSRSKSE